MRYAACGLRLAANSVRQAEAKDTKPDAGSYLPVAGNIHNHLKKNIMKGKNDIRNNPDEPIISNKINCFRDAV